MVVKFNPDGRVVMVFGRKKEASDEAGPWTRVTPPRPPVDGQFRQPTDVTWDTEGNIFISDGYINSRVAKFDKNGDWVKSWGEPGNKPGQFDTPHSIAADSKGNIYVADRELMYPVADENVSLGVPCDVGRLSELPIDRGARRSHAGPRTGLIGGFLFPSEDHDDAAVRIELDHHIRTLVHGPASSIRT